MIITVLYLLFNSSSSIRVDRHAFITSGDFYRGLYSNLTTRIIDREKPIMVVLNFKCYLNNDDFDRVAQSIGQLIPSPNVKLLISPPNIHLHKFRNSSSNNYKYELCSQNMSTFRGFGAYTGEITAEMLKDIGVNWCLIGHPETGLNTEMQNGEEKYSENVKKMINSIETNITPILILLGNGNTKCKDNDDCMKHTCKCTCMCKNINVENEISMLVKKLDKYCSMLRERYPSRDLHINVAYESKESIGSGVPVNPGIVKQIVEGLQYWCSEVSQHGVNINVLYGGSLNADIAKDYVDAGCDGLLFGKYSIKADMQKLIDNLR